MNPSDPLSVAPIGIPQACLRMIRLGAAMAAAAALSGCASFSPDGGMSVAAGIAAQELEKDTIVIRTPEDATSARARVEDLLKRPFTADAAVQIALLNNRGLQAAYNELGLAETMMVQASLPPNPSFSFSRISGPLEYDIEAAIAADILALATMPARSEIAADQFRAAQLRAAEETLRVAAETRRNYYRAVAAQELVGFLTQANAAAETAARLAGKLGATGAMNKLDQARDQVFHAEVTARLAAARQQAASEREQLIGRWVFGGAISALSFRTHYRHCRNIHGRCRRRSRTPSVAESIYRSRASKSRHSQSHTGSRAPLDLSIFSSCLASIKMKRKTSLARKLILRISGLAPRLRSPYSISARSACAKPSRPICWP